MSHGFNNLDFWEWLVDRREKTGQKTERPITHAILSGEGPFELEDFGEFLATEDGIAIGNCDLDEYLEFLDAPDETRARESFFNEVTRIDTLVLGREGWVQAEIDDLLHMERGKPLTVYSQEMLLAQYASGVNPYTTSNFRNTFLDDHSGLQYLLDSGFDWPDTRIVPYRTSQDATPKAFSDWGFLSHKGYHVGKQRGRSVHDRREILADVFERAVLPEQAPPEAIEAWGRAGSAQRLLKLANCLAAFSRNAKYKKRDMSLSVGSWEADLAWLKATYYDYSVFDFQWPSP